jgi:hypothetical protein
MAKQKAVYAPGELSKTRERLGEVSKDEAKRMTELLGGEVGYERTDDQEEDRLQKTGKRVRNETVQVDIGRRRRPKKDDGDEGDQKAKVKKQRAYNKNVVDDPAVSLKTNYWQRIKIDKYCGQAEFEIKSASQVFISIISFLADPVDYVNSAFVMRRLNNFYKRIELLVTSVRSLLPRNNQKRNEDFKKTSPFAYAIMDTLRYWNIEKFSSELTRIQTHPRSVKVVDLIEIIRVIYRPLYILDKLEQDTHIKEAFKTLYKYLCQNTTDDYKEKHQRLVRAAIASYGIIYQDIRFQMYPLLMKLVSHCWVPYEAFFQERKNRISAFLQVTEAHRISPQMEGAMTEDEAGKFSGEQPDEIEAEENEAKKAAEKAAAEEEQKKDNAYHEQTKVVDRSLVILEYLFPRAGWDRIRSFPDFYPYFSDMFKVKKGVALIPPNDPLHQVYFLTRILEELIFGLRYVSFGSIVGPEGKHERLDEPMARIINDWQKILEASFDKEYLSRLGEYCSMLENTAESRTSNYAKRIINELNWVKRLYFFPFYRFTSIMPTPFSKNTLTALYPIVHSLRHYFTVLTENIEQATSPAGTDKRPPCDGIENPWDAYVFQVPNPVSRRLDEILLPKKRNNASLVYVALAIVIVLDHLMNEEISWAYSAKTEFLFRSENGEGARPLFGVDLKIDTESTFKQAQKKRQMEGPARSRAVAENETWNIFT